MKGTTHRFLILTFWVLTFASLLLVSCEEGDIIVESPTKPGVCGDGICSGGETPSSCPGDCGDDSATCGNGVCENGENVMNCANDCDTEAEPVCGNGICEAGEDSRNCSADCTPQCTTPSINEATVIPQFGGLCTTVPCLADGLQPSETLRRTVWTSISSLCTPATTASFNVTYVCGATDSVYTVRNLACTSTVQEDENNVCCLPKEITFRFSSTESTM